VNCSLVDGLIDDYLDNELSPRERRLFEGHLHSCRRCMEELRRRSALDRSVRLALSASVQHHYFPAAASARFMQAAQDGLGRAIWRHRLASVGQVVAGAAAVVLVLVGVYAAAARLSLIPDLDPVTLFPVKQLVSSGRDLVDVTPGAAWDPEKLQPPAPLLKTQPALFLSPSGSFVDPEPMLPGQPFTITLFVHTNVTRPLESADFDLEIIGPTGYFRFPLSVDGPLPARGVALVRVTTEALAKPCREKYMIAPTSIFGVPGTYRLRYTLLSPGSGGER
jgi:hypothetical protein